MEGDGIETVIRHVSQEEPIVGGGHIRGCEETGRLLRKSSTTTTAKISEKYVARETEWTYRYTGTQRVATSNFTSDEEVFLPELGGAFPNAHSQYRGGIEGYLRGLIDSNPVKVESFQRQVEVNQSVHGERPPLSEMILHGSESG